jgi:excisionase family DNA binding protein
VANLEIEKPLLIKVRRAAQLADCSVSQMYVLITQGKVPAVRIGGGRSLRVPLSAIEDLAHRATEPEGRTV